MYPEIIHASIAYPALITALNELQYCYDDYKNSYWARSIRYRLKTEDRLIELSEVTDDEIKIYDISSVASILLNDPYNRMFNSLPEFVGDESISDE
jgi:hypothetical protein